MDYSKICYLFEMNGFILNLVFKDKFQMQLILK